MTLLYWFLLRVWLRPSSRFSTRLQSVWTLCTLGNYRFLEKFCINSWLSACYCFFAPSLCFLPLCLQSRHFLDNLKSESEKPISEISCLLVSACFPIVQCRAGAGADSVCRVIFMRLGPAQTLGCLQLKFRSTSETPLFSKKRMKDMEKKRKPSQSKCDYDSRLT